MDDGDQGEVDHVRGAESNEQIPVRGGGIKASGLVSTIRGHDLRRSLKLRSCGMHTPHETLSYALVGKNTNTTTSKNNLSFYVHSVSSSLCMLQLTSHTEKYS